MGARLRASSGTAAGRAKVPRSSSGTLEARIGASGCKCCCCSDAKNCGSQGKDCCTGRSCHSPSGVPALATQQVPGHMYSTYELPLHRPLQRKQHHQGRKTSTPPCIPRHRGGVRTPVDAGNPCHDVVEEAGCFLFFFNGKYSGQTDVDHVYS